MSDEVSEKEIKKNTVSITIPQVPISVHNKIKKYHRRIMAERQKDYGLMAAYAEFLKEATKTMPI
jgi:hypothetical protein